MRIWRHAGGVTRWVAALAVVAPVSLGAAAAAGPAPIETTASVPPTAASASDAIDLRRKELGGIETDLSAAEAERRRIVGDIEQLRTDRVRLNAALIDTTRHVRDADEKAAAIEERLSTMTASQAAIRQSLEARRGVLAEVLASLQRMGRKPPPALLASPDDMLRTIRTSMLLGALLPELREQAEALAGDLAELARLRQSIGTERDALAAQVTALSAEKLRLAALVEARQTAQANAEASLGSEQGRTAELAGKAASLKDLIARMESDVAAARRAGDAARNADVERKRLAEADADSVRQRVAAGPFRDPARLAPAVDFPATKGLLNLPVAGRLVKAFGGADGFGGTERGLSLATRTQAVVSAPADGWVAFSGPYRSYGQILILNVGGGYHVVLAGMTSVTVAPGQFVLAGEPVAIMGDGSVKTAAAIALGAADPVLYVEFRKDGAAVDPSPWWVRTELEKVRG